MGPGEVLDLAGKKRRVFARMFLCGGGLVFGGLCWGEGRRYLWIHWVRVVSVCSCLAKGKFRGAFFGGMESGDAKFVLILGLGYRALDTTR